MTSSPAPLGHRFARSLLLAVGALIPLRTVPAQHVAGAARPTPYPVVESVEFGAAVARGTRTRTGHPGPAYWQQWAEYRLSAELDPATHRLAGQGTVRYTNRSPDTLAVVFFHLYQDLFAPDAIRNRVVPVTGPVELTHVAVAGHELTQVAPNDTAPGYARLATILRVRFPAPLAPGGTEEFEFSWSFIVPPNGAPRSGHDEETFMIAYWYPQAAVYDDFGRWQIDPYMGNAEFYMGYADYDVSLTVPGGWLVAATGTLENATEVLAKGTRDRLARARRTREVVHVVTEADRDAGRATNAGRDGRLTWRFRARNVRDFSWATSDRYLWDAAAAVVGDANGDGRADSTVVHTLYRPAAHNWPLAARYAQHSIEFLSRYLWPYPYPHMTAIDGMPSCGGMEYPMLTCIGGSRDTIGLYGVTVHEIAHMWFPMQVGSDEKRYAWQDEGLTRFNQSQAMREFFPGYDREAISFERYLNLTHFGREVEIMRHGDLFPFGTAAYGVATYEKTSAVLAMLRALVGEELFLRAYRKYGQLWVNKHPAPEDLFNTFAEVSGRDLTWFWRTWMFETWTLDHALGSVRDVGDSLEFVIEDRGLAPMPARVTITRSGGRAEHREVPADVWLAGARADTLRVGDGASVIAVEIDADSAFADVDRTNQAWAR